MLLALLMTTLIIGDILESKNTCQWGKKKHKIVLNSAHVSSRDNSLADSRTFITWTYIMQLYCLRKF